MTRQSLRIIAGDDPQRATLDRTADSFMVINDSPGTVIWCDNDSSVTVGNGTPLYGGTSLRWTYPQLWIVGEEEADVIVTSDVDQWEADPVAVATAILNSGQLIVDDPIQVFLGGFGSSGTGEFDVSKYQTVSITMNCGGLTSVTNPTVVRLRFTSAGQTVLTRILTFINAREVQMTFPIVGDSVSLRTTLGPDVSVAQITLSHRQNSLIQSFSEGHTLVHRTNLTIADGTSLDIDDMTPYFGECFISCAYQGTGPGDTNVRLMFPDAFGGLDVIDALGPFNTVGANYRIERARVVFSGMPCRFRIANQSGSSQDFNLYVAPVLFPGGSI